MVIRAGERNREQPSEKRDQKSACPKRATRIVLHRTNASTRQETRQTRTALGAGLVCAMSINHLFGNPANQDLAVATEERFTGDGIPWRQIRPRIHCDKFFGL